MSWLTTLDQSMMSFKVKGIHRVVDGDTYDLRLDLGFYQYGIYRIRLLGFDTPEVFGRYASQEGHVAKTAAVEWFAEHLPHGDLWCSTEKADSFGRWLGMIVCKTCYNDEKPDEVASIGEYLFANEHAEVWQGRG